MFIYIYIMFYEIFHKILKETCFETDFELYKSERMIDSFKALGSQIFESTSCYHLHCKNSCYYPSW